MYIREEKEVLYVDASLLANTNVLRKNTLKEDRNKHRWVLVTRFLRILLRKN